MYVGATTHKNSLGILCAFIFTSIIWEWTIARRDSLKLYNKYNRKIGIISYLALLIMALWMLTISNSATSSVVSCIGVLVVLLMEVKTFKKKIRYIGRFILITVVMVFIFNTAFDMKGLIFSSLGREATLTGRTEVWEQVLNEDTNPLIGTGYESFWLGDRLTRFWQEHWWKPNQAHNGYLEVYLNLGMVSLGLYPIEQSYVLLSEVGVHGWPAPLALFGAALLDMALGVATLGRFRIQLVGKLQIILMLGYSILISMGLSEMWLHPFGPITKNIPLIIATMIMLSLEKD